MNTASLSPQSHVMNFGKLSPKTKVDRYRWSLEGDPGKLRMIHKSALCIDTSYQREINKAKVLAIARDWSWARFGALIVSIRDDGNAWIVDGGHRKSAADLRHDITHLPCLTYTFKNVGEEALTFVKSAKNRVLLSAYDVFRAELGMNDADAIEIVEMLEATGHRPKGKSANTTSDVLCIAAIKKAFRQNKEACKAAWEVTAHATGSDYIHGDIFEGLYYLANTGVDIVAFKDKLKNEGRLLLLQAIAKSKAFFSRGGPKVYAAGLMTVINKRRQAKNRIEIE